MNIDEGGDIYLAKEISWLEFNARVLEEAESTDVPLIQRVRFLGIYSSNLDEFFRIRVAILSRLIHLKRKSRTVPGGNPRDILRRIQEIVLEQSERFDAAWRSIVGGLERENIFIVNEETAKEEQLAFAYHYFRQKVRRILFPILVHTKREFPALRDRSVYLFVRMWKEERPEKTRYALIEIPAHTTSRFIHLPDTDGRQYIMLLDDVLRANIRDIFSMFDFDRFGAYTIKLTRDSAVDIDIDFSESMIKKISKSIRKRREGEPVRFVYDETIPKETLEFLIEKLGINNTDVLIPGGRYHNFTDFMTFPNVGKPKLEYNRLAPIIPEFVRAQRSILKLMRTRDFLLYYPYHPFDVMVDLIRESAIDPKVTSIKITIYRAAKNSNILNALINAVKNGKAVTVIIELQARFDEEANIRWANNLRDEGVFVNYGVPGLKVHAKLCLITRAEKSGARNYAVISTGNFNEDTARVYTDHCFFTADSRISNEVKKIFDFLESMYKFRRFNHLVVAPFFMREHLVGLINEEIRNAKKKLPARIILKINNLVDTHIIDQLYEASRVGVKVTLIVRGMLSLVPGIAGVSDNVTAVRIVDRFLEHGRVLVFHNNGHEKVFISSADFMQRNLDKRIEVFCPIYDDALRSQLIDILDIYMADTIKVTPHHSDGQTRNVGEGKNDHHASAVRAQTAIHEYLSRPAATGEQPVQ